jgi:hypothetical protein
MIMDKYFWKNDEVYVYSEIQIEQGYADGLKELTEQELEDYLNPFPTPEELAEQVRAERDILIQQIEWRVSRHYQELELDLTPTEELRPLIEYIQALRDVPQQEGFPNNITWPEVPDDRQL